MNSSERGSVTLNSELLSLLVCPETRQPLRAASDSEREILRLRRGDATEDYLVRADRAVAYPIQGGTPHLLVGSGFDMTGLALAEDSLK